VILGAQWSLWHLFTVPLYTLVFFVFSSLSIVKRFVRDFFPRNLFAIESIRNLPQNLNHQQNQFLAKKMELLLFLVQLKEIVEYDSFIPKNLPYFFLSH
jgi:hypothetical protein